LWFPARKDKCANPNADGKQGDGAGNDDDLLSVDRDTERLGINDFFSRRVCHFWRSDQNQSQKAADDFQPQRFCSAHVRMVADVNASRAGAS
jgi:hypothetical protein